ncbi:MAG TPA: hypothetical protein VH120_13145 [Gemmataceae bacterium]|nr:hypothetical protein [Gemmataceae bacterium]
MLFASNYRGKIPLELYLKLQSTFPQMGGESDGAWLFRVKRDPMLAQKMFGTPEFKTDLIQAVHRRAMAQAGARRTGKQTAGPTLITLSKPGATNANTTIAPRYRQEFMIGNENQYKYAKEAYEQLLEQFDAATPGNGSIFWNGINELALAKLVDEWNTDLKGEVFGQLEATTAARYVNKQFEWDQGGVFQKYFTEVSDRLGQAARGHVTSVVRCGLRFDSIFTVTELPRMLKSMEDEIKAKKAPTVTDITIVVIEPKTMEERPVASFTNNEITMIPIVRPLPGRRINGRNDCSIDGRVAVGARLREYWSLRKGTTDSAAAIKIKADFGKLVKWP